MTQAILPNIQWQIIAGDNFEVAKRVQQLRDYVADGIPSVNASSLADIAGDGVTDDGPSFQDAYDALHGTGQSLYVPPGTYLFRAQGIDLRNGKAVPIIFAPGVTIITDLAPNQSDVTGIWLSASATFGVATTLSSDLAIGALTVHFTSATGFVVGDKFLLLAPDGANGSMHEIRHISGTTITLDRPSQRPMPSGTAVTRIISTVEDVMVIGNGTRLSGTCLRYVELPQTWRAVIQDMRLDIDDGGPTNSAMSYDTSSYMVGYRRICCVGTGISFESVEAGFIEDCTAYVDQTAPVSAAGFYLSDCTGCIVSNCASHGWNASGGCGVILTSQGSLGCLDCKIIGGSYTGNATGIQIHAGARNKVIGATANVNSSGIVADASPGTQIVGATAINCLGAIGITAGSTGTIVDGVDVSGCTDVGVLCLADCMLHDVYGVAGVFDPAQPNNALVAAIGCTVWVDGFQFAIEGAEDPSTTASGFKLGASGVIHASHGSVALNATAANNNQLAFFGNSASCKFFIDDVDVTGTGVNRFAIYAGATCTVRYKGFRYPSSGFTATYGGPTSRGQQTLTGGTDAVSFTDLQLSDRVRLTLADPNGGTVSFWRVQYTPGTGFSITPTNAADRSKVDWEVV